jgi:hypothetical protein
MRTMTLIVLSGLVLLFLGSLYIGPKVFSPAERRLESRLHQAEQSSSETAAAAREQVDSRKARLAFSSFDLMGGLTDRDLETIPALSLAFPFYCLLASLWLVLGLKKSPGD